MLRATDEMGKNMYYVGYIKSISMGPVKWKNKITGDIESSGHFQIAGTCELQAEPGLFEFGYYITTNYANDQKTDQVYLDERALESTSEALGFTYQSQSEFRTNLERISKDGYLNPVKFRAKLNSRGEVILANIYVISRRQLKMDAAETTAFDSIGKSGATRSFVEAVQAKPARQPLQAQGPDDLEIGDDIPF